MNARSAFSLLLIVSLRLPAFSAPIDYAVVVPDGWTKNAGSSASDHYTKNGISLMVTIDTAPAGATSQDDYVEFVKKQLKSVFKNLRFEAAKKLFINGKEARELVYTGEISGMKMKYDVVYVPKSGRVYTLTAGGMAGTFDKLNADYRAFFNSFKFK